MVSSMFASHGHVLPADPFQIPFGKTATKKKRN